MGAGIPVVVSAFPGWVRIIEQHKCGVAVDPTDAGAIAAAIQWLLEHRDQAAGMGQRGRLAVLEQYNWSSAERVLVDLYADLATS